MTEEKKRDLVAHVADGEARYYTDPLQADCALCGRRFDCDDQGKPLGDLKQCPGVRIPRTFMGPAYLLPMEKGLYGLYRDITVEDPETNEREKAGKIGPIKVLRKAEGDEQIFLRTVHPKTGEALELTEA